MDDSEADADDGGVNGLGLVLDDGYTDADDGGGGSLGLGLGLDDADADADDGGGGGGADGARCQGRSLEC